MYLGRVIGTVVATRRVTGLEGARFLVVQPLDHHQKPSGPVEVAVDRASGAEELLADLPGNTLSGDGAGVLAQGFEANVVEKEYKAILRVSPQGRPVLRSEPQPVRFTRVLYDVRDPVRVTFESGASNVCFVPEAIVYGLEVEADVTISVMEIEPRLSTR